MSSKSKDLEYLEEKKVKEFLSDLLSNVLQNKPTDPKKFMSEYLHSNYPVKIREGNPLRVLVTGAAGQIAYSLLPHIAQGSVFGYNQKVILHLLDIPQAMKTLEGVVMELQDLSFPLLAGVIATSDLSVAFNNINWAVFLGAFPRKPGMERKDLLEKNAGIFQEQGVALQNYANRDCKVLVVGNPANTNCLTLMHYCKKLPRENFTALTRLDHNRGLAMIANKVNCKVNEIHGFNVWGNHSTTQFPDTNNTYVNSTPLSTLIPSYNDWRAKTFVPEVQTRGGVVLKQRGQSSAVSAAKATADHLRDWHQGSQEVVSMCVFSNNNPYKVPDGLIFSFPVRCIPGTSKWKIVENLPLDEFAQEKLKVTADELIEERSMAEVIFSSKSGL